MSERYLTGVEMQAELLAEARRTRAAVEGIRTLLLVWFGLGVLAAIIWLFVAASL